MSFKPYARSLAIAFTLALVAGCSSTGGSQDGSTDGAGDRERDGASSRSASSSQASGSGYGGTSDREQDGRIPQQRTIYFAFDSDRIRDEFESVLAANARYLSENDDAKVVLQGHTDERGTREYNMALGERRANAVKKFLSVQGVSSSQVEVVSYGEERPAARGQNEEAFAQNRRVVFAY